MVLYQLLKLVLSNFEVDAAKMSNILSKKTTVRGLIVSTFKLDFATSLSLSVGAVRCGPRKRARVPFVSGAPAHARARAFTMRSGSPRVATQVFEADRPSSATGGCQSKGFRDDWWAID